MLDYHTGLKRSICVGLEGVKGDQLAGILSMSGGVGAGNQMVDVFGDVFLCW